jgi:UDP-galactopyranose mutase
LADYSITNYINWFYTPMMLDWAEGLDPKATVYDCMDQLSAFRGAPPELVEKEKKLFERADVVFTGGQSLYEAKREQHPNVHAFPSSIDAPHFGKARVVSDEFPPQANIPHPRIGFVGVIDERMDIPMVAKAAELRPDWQFVMVGPVVKIDEADLPRPQNIHYLGQQGYDDLPTILAGWDVAVMPFALNESTRYISPTKTPEYLAAGLPVVSTAIKDVVTPYGDLDLVRIVSTPEEFVTAIENAMREDPQDRRIRADAYLSNFSWDKTFEGMRDLIQQEITHRPAADAAAQ